MPAGHVSCYAFSTLSLKLFSAEYRWNHSASSCFNVIYSFWRGRRHCRCVRYCKGWGSQPFMSATHSQPCQLKYFWSTSSLTPAVMLHANMWIWIHVKQLVWPHLQPLGCTVSWKAILFNQWITTVTVVNPFGMLLVAFRNIYAFVFRHQTETIFITFGEFFETFDFYPF